MWTEIYLGKATLAENEFGEKSKQLAYSASPLFCKEKSVKYSEFYQAMQTGLKAEKIVSMNIYEYYDYMTDAMKKVCKVRHSITNALVEYTIIREYETDSDSIELTLARGVENVGT